MTSIHNSDGDAFSLTDPLPTASTARARGIAVQHRTAITAVDTIASPTITAAKDDTTVGVMAAAEHKAAVSAGTAYGSATPSAIVTVTPTENKCVLLTVPKINGAEHYDVFFSTDAAPKWLARVTEAERAAGAVVTAVGTVTTTGGTAGKVLVKLIGTGAVTTDARFAANVAYAPLAVATAGTGTSGAITCAGYTSAHIAATVSGVALAAIPALVLLPYFLVGGIWVPGSALTVTANQTVEGFQVAVNGAAGFVVLVKTITSGASADVWVELC